MIVFYSFSTQQPRQHSDKQQVGKIIDIQQKQLLKILKEAFFLLEGKFQGSFQ